MTTTAIDPKTGLIELPGDDPAWIWAFTCRDRGCSCRSALVLATRGERETLLARGAPVAEAWSRGRDQAAAAASLSGVTVLEIDVDSGEVAQLRGDKPLTSDDLAARPELGRVIEQIVRARNNRIARDQSFSPARCR